MAGQDRRLYACEFSNGVVKVGITGQQGVKRSSAHRIEGLPAERIYYGALHDTGYGNWSERELLQRVRNLGGVVHQGREWFTGISFAIACALVEQVTQDATVPRPSTPVAVHADDQPK